MNSTALWKERFRHFLKEVRTYSKYVFNASFEIYFRVHHWCGSVLLPAMVTNVNTFVSNCARNGSINWTRVNGWIHSNVIKRSASRLLLPVEEKLKPYFTKAFLFTFMIQLYIIAIVAARLLRYTSSK